MSSMVEQAMALLAADATVDGLVGDKIYPLIVDQTKAPPYVVLNAVSEVPLNSCHDGDGPNNTLLFDGRLQVDCYARGYLQSRQIADAVQSVLGQRNTSPKSRLLSRSDGYDDEQRLNRVSADYQVWT